MPTSNSLKILTPNPTHPLLFEEPMSLLLPFFLLSIILHAHPAAANAAAHRRHGYGHTQLLTLNRKWTQQQTNAPSCFPQRSRTEKSATILDLHHKDYCSKKPTTDWNQRLQQPILSDQIRVHSLQSRVKTAHSNGFDHQLSQAEIPLISGAKLQTLNYIVTITLGGRNVTLIVDTGSDITWVQCEPCGSCYNQQEPLFNPSQSPSFKSILCKTTTCHDLLYATGNSGVCGVNSTTCNYYVTYGDGSYTQGDLATENLVLGTTQVKDFVFGCGRDNDGLFGGASGLIGLGRSALSMVSQTYDVFGGVFSYCLPSVTENGSGSLILGDEISAYKNSSPISYTNIISDPLLTTFYFLNFTGISIGGVSLQDSSFGQKQMLIDSGTVISRLFPAVYSAVKTEFLKQFSGFPKASPFSILDTCFNLSTYEEVEIPIFEMHFGWDAKLTIDASGILYFVKSDASQVCLAFASLSDDDEFGIIGNYQQRNTRVIYNTKESTLGFARETCSSD